MTCEHLVLRKGEVVRCKLKGTYVVIFKDNREVVEVLCTCHAERAFNNNLINNDLYELRYIKKINNERR